MIPALDPDRKSDFQLFDNCGPRFASTKSIIQPWIQMWSWIFDLQEILDPDSYPVKSGIITPLKGALSS